MVEDYKNKKDKEGTYENPLKTEKEIAVKELDEMNLLPFAIPRKVEPKNIIYLEDIANKKKKEEK